MKKLFTGLILSVALCLPGLLNATESGEALIEGKVPGFKGKYIAINNNWFRVADNGSFEHKIKLEKSGFVKVRLTSEFKIYMNPGEAITLNLNEGEREELLRITGGMKVVNRFLIKEISYNRMFNKLLKDNRNRLFTLPGKEFIVEFDKLYAPFYKRIKSFNAVNSSQKQFKRYYENSLLYSRATILLKYPMFRRKIRGNENFKAAENYFAFLSKLEYGDENLFALYDYRAFIETMLKFQSKILYRESQELRKRSFGIFHARVQIILKYFKNQKLRNMMLNKEFSRYVDEYYTKDMEELLKVFRRNCTNKNYLNRIAKVVHEKKLGYEKIKKTI